eukprot:COSAG02_NODE_42554_length_383_cov_1.077465_2_plen_58_part_01
MWPQRTVHGDDFGLGSVVACVSSVIADKIFQGQLVRGPDTLVWHLCALSLVLSKSAPG